MANWAFLPLGGMILLNLGQVHPENTLDPRNYDVAAAQDLQAGHLDLLERRMDFFEHRLPGEKKTHFWRAHAALRRGHPERAAVEFVQSVRWRKSVMARMLPPPSFDEQEDFLVRLRDLCSSLPPDSHVFAYERALLAAGRDDSALATLRLRITQPSLDVTALPSVPFARALAVLLLAPSPIEKRLAEWPAPELVSILEQWGVRLERAPAGFPQDALPLVLSAGPRWDSLVVSTSEDEARHLELTALQPDLVAEGAWGSGGWGDPERQPDGTWVVKLQPPEMSAGSPWAEVVIHPEGLSTVREGTPNGPPPFVPPEPTVRMWIP
jgi:hypothetical protein